MSESVLEGWHTVSVRIPFASPAHASIAKRVIEVDPELQAHLVKRNLEVDDRELLVTFKCLTVRLVRLSINSFLENVDLIIRTLSEFGEDVQKSASDSNSNSKKV